MLLLVHVMMTERILGRMRVLVISRECRMIRMMMKMMRHCWCAVAEMRICGECGERGRVVFGRMDGGEERLIGGHVGVAQVRCRRRRARRRRNGRRARVGVFFLVGVEVSFVKMGLAMIAGKHRMLLMLLMRRRVVVTGGVDTVRHVAVVFAGGR